MHAGIAPNIVHACLLEPTTEAFLAQHIVAATPYDGVVSDM